MQTDYLVVAPGDLPSTPRRILPDALTDLSLRQLLSFRAVADEGSFHGAAAALDYTQSAVSQHVMSLETALGVRLFDRGRGRRTVELTEANSDEGLLELVEPGQLDLSFGVLPMPEGPFEAVELLHDPFVLVTQKDSALSKLEGMPSI